MNLKQHIEIMLPAIEKELQDQVARLDARIYAPFS